MISRVLISGAGLLLLVASAAISPAKADSVVYDQTNFGLPLGTLSQSLLVFSPLGQSFTPTLTSLNVVDLLTSEGSATVEIDIRSGSILGPIVGTSAPTAIPFSLTSSVSAFNFSELVTLIPGDLYVIEPVSLSGDVLIASSDTNNYPGGTQILGGVAQPDNDLWFQEGIETPEPGALPLLGAGLLGLLGIAFLQKRCIQDIVKP
jgi:hypothetical protein